MNHIAKLGLAMLASLNVTAFAETAINLNALCYQRKNECIQARALVGGRSNLPLYSYVQPCVQDQISPERGRSFCAKGQWRLATQVRSSWSLAQINNYLNKFGSAPLRTTCVESNWRAREIINLVSDGAGGNWQSIRGDHKIKLSYRKATAAELEEVRYQECQQTPILVEYQLTR